GHQTHDHLGGGEFVPPSPHDEPVPEQQPSFVLDRMAVSQRQWGAIDSHRESEPIRQHDQGGGIVGPSGGAGVVRRRSKTPAMNVPGCDHWDPSSKAPRIPTRPFPTVSNVSVARSEAALNPVNRIVQSGSADDAAYAAHVSSTVSIP